MGRKASKKASIVADSAEKMSKATAMLPQASAPSKKKVEVIGFYSDKAGRPFREFSNFFSDAPPFRFVLPAFARCEGLPEVVDCEFSEKAIMVAKAAMMGDQEMFHQIAVARYPKECKDLGRGVRGFDVALWDSHLEELAFEVVKQKFAASKQLRAVLLSTGSKIIAEAAPNDCIWGIGIRLGDDRVSSPSDWCGRNVLGHALMRARSHLRGDAVEDDGDDDASLLPAGYGGDESVVPNATSASVQQSAILEFDPEENFLRPVTDMEAVCACYERYGVVGITGVLSADECQALIVDGLESHLPEGCHMDDVTSFDLADRAVNRYGVIGKEALFSPAVLAARLHPNVVAAYTAVYGREDVFACHDRAAWMRPVAINSAWATPFSWPGLHFDISLTSYFGDDSRSQVDDFLNGIAYEEGTSTNFVKENAAKHKSMGRTVQGVLNLYDNDEEDGGFQCVPGMFGASLQQWVRDHPALPTAEPNGKYELKGFGVDAKLGAHAVRVPCPAGTLILFDATLPHGTRPNISAKSRAILFLRYLTSEELPGAAWRNRNAALRRMTDKVGFGPDSRQVKYLYGPE